MRTMLKSKNLIPFPYTTIATIGGITHTFNLDGSITLKGTRNGNAYLGLYGGYLAQKVPVTSLLEVGKTYTISGGSDLVRTIIFLYPESGNSRNFTSGSFTITENDKYIGIFLYVPKANATVDETIYPMLNEGSVALPYQSYFCEYQGIGRSKNLIPQYYYIGVTKTSNGVTAVGLDNGMLKVTGTSTARPVFTLIYERPIFLPIGTYSAINANIPQGCTLSYAFKLADGTTKTLYVVNGSNKTTLTQDAVAISVYFYGFVNPAVSTYDYTVSIMLVEFDGYYSGEYQPYLQRYDMYMYDNLLKMPYAYTDTTAAGVTFTVDKNTGYIMANGTNDGTTWSRFYIRQGTYEKLNGKYFYKGTPSGGAITTYRTIITVRKQDGTTENFNDIGNGITFTADNWLLNALTIVIYTNATANNLVFKPELIRLIGD